MTEPCPGCPASFAPHDGATHPYIGASAACWTMHASVLAGYPPDDAILAGSTTLPVRAAALAAPPGSAGLLLDAYATQHHGVPSPQAIQSVAVHVLVLHAVLGRGVDPTRALWVRQQALRRKGVFSWLTPPPVDHALSLRHCFPGAGHEVASVERYVGSVYQAWAERHRAQLDAWYEAYVADAAPRPTR